MATLRFWFKDEKATKTTRERGFEVKFDQRRNLYFVQEEESPNDSGSEIHQIPREYNKVTYRDVVLLSRRFEVGYYHIGTGRGRSRRPIQVHIVNVVPRGKKYLVQIRVCAKSIEDINRAVWMLRKGKRSRIVRMPKTDNHDS